MKAILCYILESEEEMEKHGIRKPDQPSNKDKKSRAEAIRICPFCKKGSQKSMRPFSSAGELKKHYAKCCPEGPRVNLEGSHRPKEMESTAGYINYLWDNAPW